MKNLIKNIIKEEIDKMQIPQYLFHATYKPLLKKIKEFGLDSNRGRQLWDDSIKGYTYLSDDKDYAASFAESTDANIPDSWLDNIIILTIDTNTIDKSKLFIDTNNTDEELSTFEYRGIISPSSIVKVESYD